MKAKIFSESHVLTKAKVKNSFFISIGPIHWISGRKFLNHFVFKLQLETSYSLYSLMFASNISLNPEKVRKTTENRIHLSSSSKSDSYLGRNTLYHWAEYAFRPLKSFWLQNSQQNQKIFDFNFWASDVVPRLILCSS